MDPKIFEVLGKYAGLAGLSIGVVLVLFFTLLKLDIFPKLKNAQANDLLKHLIYLTFVVGIVGIVAWLSINHKGVTEHSITGKVVKIGATTPVGDAEITVEGRTETTRTDSVGYFELRFGEPFPVGRVHLFISKQGFDPYSRFLSPNQYLQAEIAPIAPAAANPPQGVTPPQPQLIATEEAYRSDDLASGACADFGAWATVCTPDKPAGWTIVSQHFELEGDRRCGNWAKCEPLGTITQTKACYRFQTQGHSEECKPFSGNTGIHNSMGVLRVVWQHPA